MLERLSLRSRLVLGVLALATVGLVAADIATYTSLRSFLFDRTDSSLESAHREAEAELLGTGPSPSDGETTPSDRGPEKTSVSRLQDLTRSLPGLFIKTRDSAGNVTFSDQVPEFAQTGTRPSAPTLPKTISLKPPSGGSPDRVRYLTVPSIKGDVRYRVRASLDPGSTSLLILATSLSGVGGTLHRTHCRRPPGTPCGRRS